MLVSLGALGHETPAPAPAKVAPQASTVARDVTMSLVGLSAQFATATPGEQGQLIAQLVSVAKQRHDELAALLEIDPAEVLRVAIPPQVLASLPPQAIPFVEQSADEDGTLEVYHVDHVNPADDYYLHFLTTKGNKRYALYFADAAPNLVTGASVHVHGKRIDSAIVLESGNDLTVTDKASALPNTLGVQKTLTILVNFTDEATQPYTLAQAQSVMFTTTSNYDYETSYQQTSLTGAVVGWFTIASSSTTCDYTTIASQAQSAATKAGVNLSSYNRYVYVFPANTCTWWGLGTIGGNPSQAWIHSKWGFSLPVVGHEMGHNFGLYHSHSLDCGSAAIASTGCTMSEYGDIFDMMGSSNNTPHYNAFQKERLGWLNAGVSPPLITVPATPGTVTYTIGAMEDARNTTPRALKIPRGTSCTSTSEYFYVESRQAKGFDSFLSGNANVQGGVLIHDVNVNDANSSDLLDMTPATTSWSDPALVAGQSFTDPLSGLTITTLSAGTGGATVNVTFQPSSCTRAAPAVTIAPTGTVWTSAGSSTNYSVTVTNKDSCGCAATTYDVGAAVPSGWSASSARTASVVPGSSTSSSILVTNPASTPAAFYTVGLDASNSSASTLQTAVNGTVAVVTSLAVAASTDKSSYALPRQKNTTIYALITTTVTSSGAPVGGAAVNVNMTDPNKKVTTLTATTNASGTAAVSYAMKQRTSPTGTYSVSSKGTIGSMTGTATASFTVQ